MPHVARIFQDSCGSFLRDVGFSSEPDEFSDTYQSVSLMYTSDKGFILSFWFVPNDGKFVSIRCGRRWSCSHGTDDLSGLYRDLAKRFGYSLPKTYSLDGSEKIEESLAAIDRDLAESLPSVLSKMTIDDIEAIERKRYGVARFMQHSLRRTPSRSITVSKIEFGD